MATNIDQLKLFNTEPVWQRLLLFVPVALILTGVWVAARWFIGNTMASYPADVRMARSATRLAPDNPQAHYTLGVFNKNGFLPEELDKSLMRYKRATSLSPNDYRLWLELGQAYLGRRPRRRGARVAPRGRTGPGLRAARAGIQATCCCASGDETRMLSPSYSRPEKPTRPCAHR